MKMTAAAPRPAPSFAALFLVLTICSAASAAPAAPPAPHAPLALAEAAARAVLRSPALAAAAEEVRAAEAARRQAAARANPSLRVEEEEFGGDRDGFGEAQTTVSLARTFETGGKRGARLREGDRAVEAARARMERTKRELAAETRRRFVRALGLSERVRTLAATEATAAEFEATVRELVRAGEVSPIEAGRARNELALARLQRESAEAELAAAKAELVGLWNGAAGEAAELAGALDDGAAPPPLEPLLARAADAPDVVVEERAVAVRAAALDGARRARVPDVDVEVGVRRLRESGETTYVAALAVPLPLLDKKRGAIAAAAAELARAERGRDAETARAVAAIRAAHVRWTAARRQTDAIRGEILPAARDVLDAYAEGYRRGRFPLLDLLDARRALLDAELRLNDSMVQLGIARADLERLCGPAGE